MTNKSISWLKEVKKSAFGLTFNLSLSLLKCVKRLFWCIVSL